MCDSLGFAILSPTVCGRGIIRVENRYGTFCGFKNRELVVVKKFLQSCAVQLQ